MPQGSSVTSETKIIRNIIRVNFNDLKKLIQYKIYQNTFICICDMYA